ncbi:MAG: hypothetical protein KDD47_01530 [Acidobacteria bacterium]|nr:hypothetical protein [Acidobacteriota bacterium]
MNFERSIAVLPPRPRPLLRFAVMGSRLLLPLLLSAAAVAGTGPFGVSEGLDRVEVEAIVGPLEEVGPSVLLATKFDSSFPELESLSFFVSPQQGLCRIQATSEVIPSDGRGRPLRDRFDRLLERLWEVYGHPEVIDRLSAGSAWAGEDAWMVALYERDRVLMTLWSEDQGSEVPAGVKRIVLSARALKPEEGFLSLDYFFSNWERCKSHFVDSPVLATPEPHP